MHFRSYFIFYRSTEDAAKAEAKKLNSAILSDQTEEDKEKEKAEDDLTVDNQKFGLCHALLELGAWEHAVAVMKHLPINLLMAIPKVINQILLLFCYLVV